MIFDSDLRHPYHAPAMGNPLFDRKSASDFGAAGLVVEFKEKLGSFDRLAAAVEQDLSALDAVQIPENWRDAPVSGRLEFGFSAQQPHVVTLSGSVEADVDAVCQRCLEPFAVSLSPDLRYLLQPSDESVLPEDGFDTWELDEPTLRAADIVDEVLVMALPLSARHEREICTAVDTDSAPAGETTRPFAKLREQMAQDD